MKHLNICVSLFLCLLLLICGASCRSNSGKIDGEPPIYSHVAVHSYDEVEKMRAMINCENSSELDEYLYTVDGLKSDYTRLSKDDLILFISRVDAVSYFELIDSKINYMAYSWDKHDPRPQDAEVLVVTSTAPNEEFVTFKYCLSVDDVDEMLNWERENAQKENLLTTPVQSSDGKVVVYIENRTEKHNGPGTFIDWVAVIDGIYTYITYYTLDESQVNTQVLISNLEITGISVSETE